MQELLKEKGYKITPARLAILGLFAKSKKPIDADNVYRKLASKNFDQATVYRTIASFEKSGILRRVDLRKDSVHYELAEEHHHHIVCTNCKNVEDFENNEIENALSKLLKKSSRFKSITEHSLEIFGLCRA